MSEPPYTLQIHRHRFAIWTASSAVSPRFTKARFIRAAIDLTELQSCVDGKSGFHHQSDFDYWHRRQCTTIYQYWLNLPPGSVKGPSFGRAAKVVAIYLKTTVGLRDVGAHPMQAHLHPPIDRILLNNMRKQLGYTIASLPNWTQLDENEYAAVLTIIKDWMKIHRPGRPLWEVEEFWE